MFRTYVTLDVGDGAPNITIPVEVPIPIEFQWAHFRQRTDFVIEPNLDEWLAEPLYNCGDICYLIRCGTTNFYKLGVTGNLADTLEELQKGSPFTLTYVAVAQGGVKFCAKLRSLLDDTREAASWVELTEVQLKMVKTSLWRKKYLPSSLKGASNLRTRVGSLKYESERIYAPVMRSISKLYLRPVPREPSSEEVRRPIWNSS